MKETEAELRSLARLSGTIPGADYFKDHVGRFGEIDDTRFYMRARFDVVKKLLKVDSKRAVETALQHSLGLLKLCRRDRMGVRDWVPPLFLRLGRDQQMYDFVKWWAATAANRDYEWRNMSNPFLNIRDADVFEGVAHCNWMNLSHTACVLLLKIRLLGDLQVLKEGSSAITAFVTIPQEILDQICMELVAGVVKNNKKVMGSADRNPIIHRLSEQIVELYNLLKEKNKYFIPALIKDYPKDHLTASSEMDRRSRSEEMAFRSLCYCGTSWKETPGAIEVLRKLHEDQEII